MKEDLTAEDRATRARLKARKNGEKAYLIGNKAFVNGREIKG